MNLSTRSSLHIETESWPDYVARSHGWYVGSYTMGAEKYQNISLFKFKENSFFWMVSEKQISGLIYPGPGGNADSCSCLQNLYLFGIRGYPLMTIA